MEKMKVSLLDLAVAKLVWALETLALTFSTLKLLGVQPCASWPWPWALAPVLVPVALLVALHAVLDILIRARRGKAEAGETPSGPAA